MYVDSSSSTVMYQWGGEACFLERDNNYNYKQISFFYWPTKPQIIVSIQKIYLTVTSHQESHLLA